MMSHIKEIEQEVYQNSILTKVFRCIPEIIPQDTLLREQPLKATSIPGVITEVNKHTYQQLLNFVHEHHTTLFTCDFSFEDFVELRGTMMSYALNPSICLLSQKAWESLNRDRRVQEWCDTTRNEVLGDLYLGRFLGVEFFSDCFLSNEDHFIKEEGAILVGGSEYVGVCTQIVVHKEYEEFLAFVKAKVLTPNASIQYAKLV